MRLFPDAFPLELPASEALKLQLASVALGGAAFAAARGRSGLMAGAAFGLIASAVGWCASRWPQLARAIELCGGVFLSIVLSTVLTTALAVTYAALAAALVREDWRPLSRRLVLSLVAVWAIATFGTDAALSRVWGFGPRSLAAAAGVPTNHDSRTLSVVWLYPTRNRPYHVDTRRMSSETTDLAPDSIDRVETFLERSRFRGVFAGEALAAVRRSLAEDADDFAAFAERASEPDLAFEDVLKDLKRRGKL